jgi:hypothetical protein
LWTAGSAPKENLSNRALFEDIEMPPKEVVKSSNFWILWVLYFIGAGAGLMVVVKDKKDQLRRKMAGRKPSGAGAWATDSATP